MMKLNFQLVSYVADSFESTRKLEHDSEPSTPTGNSAEQEYDSRHFYTQSISHHDVITAHGGRHQPVTSVIVPNGSRIRYGDTNPSLGKAHLTCGLYMYVFNMRFIHVCLKLLEMIRTSSLFFSHPQTELTHILTIVSNPLCSRLSYN